MTSSFIHAHQPPFEEVYSKKKGNKFFPSRVDPFSEGRKTILTAASSECVSISFNATMALYHIYSQQRPQSAQSEQSIHSLSRPFAAQLQTHEYFKIY